MCWHKWTKWESFNLKFITVIKGEKYDSCENWQKRQCVKCDYWQQEQIVGS